MLKGQVSLEFIFAFLIILITLYLFINTNIYFKETLKEKINFKNINQEICFIKEKMLTKNNGVLVYDACRAKKSTSNDT
ncbi:hypothetical protein GW835_03835 [archaeon]|nr:hypothetical protein [archaeon]NCP79668.1 hypothetical protein [archaeon]NCP97958.1 hypothetical protein [archaeon]NCQ07434.1 hypothetical protein [archaeon]NCQ51225.1 hypothetical protein [archaeon]